MTIHTSLLETNLDTDQAHSADFSRMLEEYDFEPPRRGQVLEGIITSTSRAHELFLDVGLKRSAIVPRQDLDRLEEQVRERLTPGEAVKVVVISPYSREGDLLVSVGQALELDDWQRAQDALESGEVVDVRVIGQNRGGLLVRFERLQGFIPNSHASSIPRGTSHHQLGAVKTDLLGAALRVKVIEVTRERSRLVMSEREARKADQERRMQELAVGQVITGYVVHIVPYGAFVNLDGVDGLIHISRLAYHHVAHPADILTIGEEVEVLIAGLDYERSRISLDRKALLPSPYEQFAEEHQPGELLTGIVTNTTDYGVFVQIADDVHGLVHVGDMTAFGVSHPDHMFCQGDEVLVRIMDINVERERIRLSMDAVSPAEYQAWLHLHRKPDTAHADEADEALEA